MEEFLPALAYEKATDGGFYTQDDMREMISYAKDRNITILPEIDVPAHSLALIASLSKSFLYAIALQCKCRIPESGPGR